MPPTSAAMELKVLINILSSGTALKTLLSQTNQLSTALTQIQTQAGKAPAITPPAVPPAKPIDETAEALKRLDAVANRLGSTMRFLAGGFLALQSIRFLKDLADTAARAQVLATVLHVVGNNAGYSTAALDKASRQVQSLGITASAASQSLTQFIQAELDLAQAPELARAAQDAAVILGSNSSVAFERLVTAVQTSNTLMLRHMGIIVSADQAYSKYASSIGKTVTQLTAAQRSQAFLNATLEQTKKIQGSYLAAMGDVGKQLSTLERLTTDLKTSLGNGLLPAYLAIVQELSDFLKRMELTADAMYGQGEGAKALGKAVQEIAHAFFMAVEFLVKWRSEIAFVIGSWLLFAKVLMPIVGFIQALTLAMGGGAAVGLGGATGALIARITLLRFGLIGLGILFLELVLYSERFRDGLGALGGVFAIIIRAVIALYEAFDKGLLAVVKTLWNMMAHPFSPETWLEPWKEWSKGVKAEIDDIKSYWGTTKRLFQESIGTGTQTPEEKAESDRKVKFLEEANIIADITEKERQYNEVKATGTEAALKQTAAELEGLKKKGKELTEARKADQDARKMNAATQEGEAARLKKAVADIEANRLTNKLNEIDAKSKFSYLADGTRISKAFGEAIGQFTELLSAYNGQGAQGRVTTRRLLDEFKESAPMVKTRGELQAIRKAYEDLQKTKASPSELAEASNAVFNATRQVQEAERQEGERARREREATFLDRQERVASELKLSLEMQESINDLAEEKDKQSYARRGMDLDEYFDRRLTRMQIAQNKELEQADLRISQARAERDLKAPTSTINELETLDKKVRDAEDALALLEGENGTQAAARAKLEMEREDARIEKQNKSKQTLLDIKAAYGELDDVLAAITAKYDLMGHSANTSEERAAIAAERQKEIFEANLKNVDRLLQLYVMDDKRFQERMELERSRLDLAKQHFDVMQKTGQMTEFEATQAKNAVVRYQAEIDRQLVISKTVELRAMEASLLTKEAEILAQLATETDATKRVELETRLAAARKAVQDLSLEIDRLKLGIEASTAELGVYGRQIQEQFIKGFADAFTKSIVDFKNAGKVWVSLSQQIANDIVSVFTKAFTERLFAKMGLFKFVDSAMNFIFGGRTKVPFMPATGGGGGEGVMNAAEGGVIRGPGTGTSDSIPAMLSHGEHVMPAAQAARWMPLLEGIRTGRILPFAQGGVVQSIATGSIIPRRYASGGMVVSDGGASAVSPAGGVGNMMVSLHPDSLNMTMREWLEHEVVRQYGRR